MHILVLNAGSSSVKYQVVDPDSGAVPARGVVERLAGQSTYAPALAQVLEATKGLGIDAIGHRVVHGGERFVDATPVDDAVEAAIEACVPLAPLHNPANLAGIRAARAALPDVPQVAVFDTAFHARLPRRAKTYALDADLSKRHGLRR